MLNIAFSCISAHDPKGFGEYRRMLKIKKQFTNYDYEIETWGCTSVQIASQLLLQSGFGIDLTHQFIEGFRDPHPLKNGERAKGPFVSVRQWLNELSGATNAEPQGNTSQHHHSMQSQNSPALIECLKVINKQGSLHHWLEKSSPDISPELSPDLLLDGVIFK